MVEQLNPGERATIESYCFDREGFREVLAFYAYGVDLALDLRGSDVARLAAEDQLQAAEKTIAAMNEDRGIAWEFAEEQEKQHKKDKRTATITIIVSVTASIIVGFLGGYAAGAL